ncbi:MAG: Fic family protein [Nanoarchaeota archaeon]|nr:Fic family protein [Nanoarchaeota archaeon]
MSYTEVMERNGTKYYYRVLSVRNGKKVNKKRIYLGKSLKKDELIKKEEEADRELIFLNNLLTKEDIKLLNDIKQVFKREPKDNFQNRYEAFCSLFTYDSTTIEGNTLTLQQTSQLLFENRVPATKSLRGINEVLNHKKAFDYVLDYKKDINKEFILKLHGLVIEGTLKKGLENQKGKYRNVQVYIRGVKWIPPKHNEVPKEMTSLLSWYSKNEKKLHPLVLATYFHSAFELIHPFVDGNGRVGRLLINFILHKNKYPMINIPNKIKHLYYSALEKAQVKGDLNSLTRLLFKILKESKLRF